MVTGVLLTLLTTIIIMTGLSLLTFFLLLGTWFGLKPYLLYRFYKLQGAQGYFKPLGGFFHDRMKEARQNGDFMHYFKNIIHQDPNVTAITSNVGSKVMLYLVDPDLIKEFLNQPHLYKKAEFISGVEGLFEGQGILFNEGEQWKKQRKLLTGSFHPELLKEQVPLMARTADEVYSSVLEKAKDPKHVNIMKANQKVAGDIIGQLFFGKNYAEHKFEGLPITMGLRKLLKDGFKEMYTISNVLFGAWFIKAGILPKHKTLMNRIKAFRLAMKDIINEAKVKNETRVGEEKSLLMSLLQQQSQSPEHAMTDEEIIDNFISLFLAGTDTTGNLSSMVAYFLTQNPEVYQKVTSEVDEVIHNERDNTFEQTQKLDYTMATIKETLRKANPQGILVFRQALEDHKLRNLHIRRGTLVTFSPIFNGFNSKYFNEPEKFSPERWLPGSDQNKELKESPFAFIPFSAGPRTCLGQHLALIEAKVMVASLVKKFKLEMSSDYQLKMTNRGTYEPLENMKMSLSAR